MNINFLNQKTHKEISLTIAKNLQKIRKRRKISQITLAELSGVSLGSVKRFERTGEISLTSLIKIAISLEVEDSLAELFSEIPYLSIEEVINEGR